MEEWKSYLLSNIADIVTGKTPSTKIESYFGGGIHFITPGDINKGLKHVISTDRTLTNAGLNSIKGSIIEPNSICVSCIGNIGYVGMATMECATNQQINSLVVKSDFDADFVYYLMKYLWPEFKNFEGQSTTLSILNKGLFSKIEVRVPSLKTQECIAKLLSSFDEKIELNNRINHNLEEQAQALYKSWFVDYDPFKKNSEGIPIGWKNISLSSIMSYSGGSQPPASEFVDKPLDGYVRFVQIRDYESDSHITYIPISKRNKLCEEKDILIARYGASLGRICFGLTGAYNVALAKVTPAKSSYREFLRCYLSDQEFYESINMKGNRAVQAGFNQSDIDSFRLWFPSDESILCSFENTCSSLFETRLRLNKENIALANMRDYAMEILFKH